jgi:CRISPR/Cas system-associated exonuclease Cas4 (RecB family)
MAIMESFQFTQANLQDFVDCRRRFQLRYLLRRAWPAIESEPVLENERIMKEGALFHRMIQQHLNGIPAERLAEMTQGEDLARWWENYRTQAAELPGLSEIEALNTRRYPEVNLSATLDGFSLLAKCDLVVVAPDGRGIIIDWKTSRRRPKRKDLFTRLQTRLYPYILTKAGAHLNQGQPFQPEQVEMVYWFADFPAQPERFSYSAGQLQDDEATLHGLITEIQRLGETEFPMTDEVERCRFCVYRSLCDRGVEAGRLQENEPETEAAVGAGLDFDFEQIGEIEF